MIGQPFSNRNNYSIAPQWEHLGSSPLEGRSEPPPGQPLEYSSFNIIICITIIFSIIITIIIIIIIINI